MGGYENVQINKNYEFLMGGIKENQKPKVINYLLPINVYII